MSMSDCDWIIYGPDGTVTVDIGKWEIYRERSLKELEFTELKKKYDDLQEEIVEQNSEIEKLESKLEQAYDRVAVLTEELRKVRPSFKVNTNEDA